MGGLLIPTRVLSRQYVTGCQTSLGNMLAAFWLGVVKEAPLPRVPLVLGSMSTHGQR